MRGNFTTNTKNTSAYMEELQNEFNKMPKGVFNMTRRKIFDLSPYAIVPFETFPLFPNTDVYLKYDLSLISKNPTLKRLLSSMQAEIRVYRVNNSDCWEGWNNFITKGRSGTVTKSIPYVDLSLGGSIYTTSLPYNPMHYLNLAPCVSVAKGGTADIYKFSFSHNHGVKNFSDDTQLSGLCGSSLDTLAKIKASTALRISALPLVMYNKVCKEFQSPNLLQDNPHWYPENENHDQILPYSASGAVTTSDYDNPTKVFTSDSIVEPSAEYDEDHSDYQSYPWLNVLQFAQRKGDLFNTGSPFPDLIRGDIPTVQMLNASIDWSKLFGSGSEGSTQNVSSVIGIDSTLHYLFGGALSSAYNPDMQIVATKVNGDSTRTTELKNILSKASLQGLEYSMSQWRYLATMTVLKERLALTDGSYNGLIKSMFGHNPKWHNHNVTYCGGSRQQIVFSEVVNQSEGASAPLGDIAGRAVSSQQNPVIHIHSDDYGMFMAVLVITPDEYFCQGVDKHFSLLENAEQYFPILNNLSPDATKNKELFVSGTNDVDEDVFNYVERFSYLKSRRNQVSGLMSLPINKVGDIGAWLQNRLLGSTPNFNFAFNAGHLTDNEKAIWSVVDQAEFNAVVGCQMKYIGPIPETSVPSDMGISY